MIVKPWITICRTTTEGRRLALLAFLTFCALC